MRKAMRTLTLAILLAAVPAAPGAAQSASDEIASGDRAYAALDAERALTHYERAAELDSSSFEAAWKASRSAADLEAGARGRPGHAALLRTAERFARRAVALRPDDPEARFSMARALGLAARSVGARQRVRYANDVRAHALECIRLAPRHSGCLHVLGAWNAEVMRLGGFERFLARRLLGGRTFAAASWAEAVRYLEAAVAADPARMAHRIELAEVYVSVGRRADARQQYEAAPQMRARDYGDENYRQQAREALRRLD